MWFTRMKKVRSVLFPCQSCSCPLACQAPATCPQPLPPPHPKPSVAVRSELRWAVGISTTYGTTGSITSAAIEVPPMCRHLPGINWSTPSPSLPILVALGAVAATTLCIPTHTRWQWYLPRAHAGDPGNRDSDAVPALPAAAQVCLLGITGVGAPWDPFHRVTVSPLGGAATCPAARMHTGTRTARPRGEHGIYGF